MKVNGITVAPEGTDVKSTGEGGGTKFLREDGDGTCSWQTASGGTNNIMFSTTFRGRTRYDYWYMANASYGINYYYWTQQANLAMGSQHVLPSSHLDAYIPGWIMPTTVTAKAFVARGNITTTDTYEFAIQKGTVTAGSAGDWSMSQIGSTQSAGGTSNIIYEWKDDFSVSLSAGDMIIPYFRRSTDDDSSYSYIEASLSVLLEV